MARLDELSAILITRLQTGLWHVDFQARGKTVYEEFTHTLEAAVVVARVALERFKDDTKPDR